MATGENWFPALYFPLKVLLKTNLFHANLPFLYPLKMSENQRFSDVFRGCRNGTLAWKGLMWCEKISEWGCFLKKAKEKRRPSDFPILKISRFLKFHKNKTMSSFILLNGINKSISFLSITQPAINVRNTRTKCEICSKLTIKTPERHRWRHSGVFIVSFEHISHFVLMFLLLTLSR